MKQLLTVCATVAALATHAATNYIVPWYANPVATNVAYSAALVNDPASAAIAPKIATAWTSVSGAAALAGKTPLVKTMGDVTYFRPKFYVLCTDGDIVEFTMSKDLSSAVWTNTLTAATLATKAGTSGTASDLQVSDDGRLAFLNYGGTWKSLGYTAPTWIAVTDADACPCPDKHPVLVDSTRTFVLHFTRPRSYGVPNAIWKYNAVSIGTLLKQDGSIASYAYDPKTETGHYISTASGNGFCPAGSIGEYLDLSAGVVSWNGSGAYQIQSNWDYALGVPAGGRTPRVIVHSPNLERIRKIMDGWGGGYEEVVIDTAAIPANNSNGRPDQYDDGFWPSTKRLVLNIPNLYTKQWGAFPYATQSQSPAITNAAIAAESRWEDFNFENVTTFGGASFYNFDCAGTLSLPNVLVLGSQAFACNANLVHENTNRVEVLISPENKTVTEIGTQAFYNQANLWRVVIGGHEDGVLFKGAGNSYPQQFANNDLREVEFTGGLPLFEENMGNYVFNTKGTRTTAFIVPRETKWTNFLEGSWRPAEDSEIAAYMRDNPGRYVPFGVVTNRSLFHATRDQFIAYADSFGKSEPKALNLRFDETRGSVATTVVGGNPADANGRYEEGTVIAFTATPKNGGTFARWYGDIGTNDATSATITVTLGKNTFLAARFVHSWTIQDYDSLTRTAKATDGNFRINLSQMSASTHIFALGSPSITPCGLFDIEYVDNGNGTVTTNMLAGSSTLDLGGDFLLAGDATPWVPTAFANVSAPMAFPIEYRDDVLTFFSPGTLTTETSKALFYFQQSLRPQLTTFEYIVLDEPSLPGTLAGNTFSGTARAVKNVIFLLPSVSNLPDNVLWSTYVANDLATWDLSSVTNITPKSLTTQWITDNPTSYLNGRKAYDCYGDFSLPALRQVSVSAAGGSALSPMPYMTSLTLGGKTRTDTVTSLGNGAFAGNSSMTNLTIHADADIVVGTDIFADHAGRDTVNYKDVVYPGHTPETITFTGVAPNTDIFANLLAGIGAADDPVVIRVMSNSSSWGQKEAYIDYRPTPAEAALADGQICANEKVLGVYRSNGIVKGVFVCDESLYAHRSTVVILR